MRRDLLSYISGLIMNIKLPPRMDLTSAQLVIWTVTSVVRTMEKLLMRLRARRFWHGENAALFLAISDALLLNAIFPSPLDLYHEKIFLRLELFFCDEIIKFLLQTKNFSLLEHRADKTAERVIKRKRDHGLWYVRTERSRLRKIAFSRYHINFP